MKETSTVKGRRSIRGISCSSFVQSMFVAEGIDRLVEIPFEGGDGIVRERGGNDGWRRDDP